MTIIFCYVFLFNCFKFTTEQINMSQQTERSFNRNKKAAANNTSIQRKTSCNRTVFSGNVFAHHAQSLLKSFLELASCCHHLADTHFIMCFIIYVIVWNSQQTERSFNRKKRAANDTSIQHKNTVRKKQRLLVLIHSESRDPQKTSTELCLIGKQQLPPTAEKCLQQGRTQHAMPKTVQREFCVAGLLLLCRLSAPLYSLSRHRLVCTPLVNTYRPHYRHYMRSIDLLTYSVNYHHRPRNN